MAPVSKSIPSLINGVSQQVPAQRLVSQLEEQINCVSDVVGGLGRRRAEKHIALLQTGTSAASAFVYNVQRDQSERYSVIITDGDLKVYDLFTGAEKTVSFPNGKNYLITFTPNKSIRATRAGDYSFIVNREKTVRMVTNETPALPAEALVFVRAGSYAASYQLTIGSNTWSITCPTAAQAAGNSAMEAAVKTNTIAAAFRNYLHDGTEDSRFVYTTPGEPLGDQGFTIEVEGPLIKIKNTAGDDFSIRCTSDRGTDGFRAFKGSTARLSDLPSRGWPGFTIKITGDVEVDGGEFWVQYNAASQLLPGGPTVNTSGGWFEVAAPSTRFALNGSTMPHVLTSNGDGTFTFRQADWAEREAGDYDSIPEPSFVDKKINHAFFARGRLGFLCGENVLLSRSGGDVFNFWRKKAAQVLDDDPIDYGQTSEEVAVLDSAVVFDEDVMIFSPLAQFRLTAGDLMTPKTVNLKPISRYENDNSVQPISSGKSIYYANYEAGYSSIEEFGLRASGQGVSADSQSITEHVPQYIPGRVVSMDASANRNMLVLNTSGVSNNIYVYQHFTKGEERAQAAWHRWDMGAGKVVSVSIMDSDVICIILRAGGLYLSTISLQQSDEDDGHYHPVHLDRRVRKSQCVLSYSSAQNLTTVTLPYGHDDKTMGRFLVVERQTDSNKKLIVPYTGNMISTTQFVLSGNWTAGTKDFFAGVEMASIVEMSEQFVPDRTPDGKSVYLDGRLQLRRMELATNKTLGIVSAVSDEYNDWEVGEDEPDIDKKPVDPDDPDGPDDPNDPDDPNNPDIPDIDFITADDEAWTALKTFDSNVIQNDSITAEWLGPESELVSPIYMDFLYQFPLTAGFDVAIATSPLSVEENVTYPGGATGVSQLTALTVYLAVPDGNLGRYTCEILARSDIFYAQTSGVGGFVGSIRISSQTSAASRQGLWVLVRDNLDGGRVVHTAIFESSFTGTGTFPNPFYDPGWTPPEPDPITGELPPPENPPPYWTIDGRFHPLNELVTTTCWAFVETSNIPEEITTDTPFALRGRVGGLPAVGTSITADGIELSGTRADYQVYLFSFSDTSYYVGRCPVIGDGWFEETTPYNSSGIKWGQLWYLPGGAFPDLDNPDISPVELVQRLWEAGATRVHQDYLDLQGIIDSPNFVAPARAKITGVTGDGRYEAHYYVVADQEYFISKSFIRPDGTAYFPAAAEGRRKLKIVEVATEKVIAELGDGVGLVRSYKIPEEGTDPVVFKALKERCYLYDQSVAIIAACIKGDEEKASRWAAGLLASQTITGPDAGNFPFSVHHYSGFPPDPYYRTGGTLWCAEALGYFAGKYPLNDLVTDTGPDGVPARLALCLDHVLSTYLVTDSGHPQEGLVRGGKGRYIDAYAGFEPDYIIPWCALEHNVDAFFALRRAAVVCGRSDFTAAAATIGQAIVDKMWVTAQGRLAQGVAPASGGGYAQDLGGALDLNSWGAIFLVAFGRKDLALLTMQYLEYFHAESGAANGYTPYVAADFTSDLYQGAVPGVWSEGTFGVVLARRCVGDELGAMVDYANMYPGLTPEGYLYTTSPDNIFELQDWPNVAGTGWAILAANPQGFWETGVPGIWDAINAGDLEVDPVTGQPVLPGTPGTGGTDLQPIFDENGNLIGFGRSPTLTGIITYRSEGGSSSPYGRNGKKSGRFRFPIHRASFRAVIRFGSLDHLPFNVTSAEWEGFYTGRTRRIQ